MAQIIYLGLTDLSFNNQSKLEEHGKKTGQTGIKPSEIRLDPKEK